MIESTLCFLKINILRMFSSNLGNPQPQSPFDVLYHTSIVHSVAPRMWNDLQRELAVFALLASLTQVRSVWLVGIHVFVITIAGTAFSQSTSGASKLFYSIRLHVRTTAFLAFLAVRSLCNKNGDQNKKQIIK